MGVAALQANDFQTQLADFKFYECMNYRFSPGASQIDPSMQLKVTTVLGGLIWIQMPSQQSPILFRRFGNLTGNWQVPT